jgi:hypothetical protein
MPRKLNQLLASEKSVKTKNERELSDLYKLVQKADLFTGLVKTYQPRDEENGERQPPETKLIQLKTRDVLVKTREVREELYDIVATKDVTNTKTLASVEIDGVTIFKDVPCSFLLYMEKQLDDLETLARHLPTLPTDKQWEWDQNNQMYVTKPRESFRTKKVMKNHVKAEATEKHPAQVDVYSEDVQIGTWTTVDHSAALPAVEKERIVSRIQRLKRAVKEAREKANMIDCVEQKVGKALFDYLYGANS